MTNYHLGGTLRGTDRREAWIVDGRISFTPPDGHVSELCGWIYPGLVDAHTHPGMSHTAEEVSDAEILRRLRSCRAQGVTHIREMGAQRDVSHLDAPGLPHVIRAGRHIARSKRYIRYLAVDVEPRDLPQEAAQQCARGDGWVKIVGDWIDRSAGADSDLAPLWPQGALTDAVSAVHDMGGRVAVHTFARETIDSLLIAGVDSIEHGTGMTREHLDEARERGIIIDPTVRQIATFPQIAARATKYPVYRNRMMKMDAHREEHLAMIVEAGSHCVMGSDTAEDVEENGLACELITAVANGMSPDFVMRAASFGGRALLGLPSWEEGAPAECVVYGEDPEIDIATVRRPSAVVIDGVRGE